MKVGILGTGNMGYAIAETLLEAGHEVTVHNRTRSKAEPLRSLGAKLAESVGETCRGECVITTLSDDPAVESLAFSPEGILASAGPETIHVSMSTVSVGLVAHLAAAHKEKGQGFVAAPVFGRPEAVRAGRALVVAAGEARSVDRCRPLFASIGEARVVEGEVAERAAAVKLAGNFLLISAVECMAESMTMLRKKGIAVDWFLETVASRLFPGPVYTGYGRRVARQEFEPAAFQLQLALKDLELFRAAAAEVGAASNVGDTLRNRLAEAVSSGLGSLDLSALGSFAPEPEP